ncbi:hypothetical protein K502DRAFT_323060 [Neoconidiobolus thromboides FSU 785]|nr:hypothetical protein K502DRAFT_323060 [Neoconidiobolus thromboides FSU 785]
MKAIGDSMRILQILINVTSNAIKFTDQGTVKFDMNHFLDENNKRNLSFSIIDTGIGIEPDILPKLFTPWVQGDSSNRRLFGGSGLGLAITKSLLDMMEGDIMIESTVGKGTKVSLNFKIDSLSPDFNVESPRSQTSSPVGESKFEFYTLYESPVVIQKTGIKKEEKPAVDGPKKKLNNSKLNKLKNNRKIKKAEAEKSVSSNRIRLLLAEDNPINQAILKRFLDKMGGVDYFLAVDGEMALNEYNSHPVGYYDIILLDQSMPKMDGDTVCQKIREIDQEQIIISVSANTLLSDRKYHQSIGMNDHISKPVTYNTFQNVLTKWLNQLNNNNDTTNNTNNNNNNNISALNLNAPIAASSV